MDRFVPVLAAACFALSAATAFAQSATEPRKGPDQAQREQMKERFHAAREACKSATDQRACMTQQFCSKAQDPAKCQEFAKQRGEHMKQRAETRQKMHEACNAKRGDELMNCLREQRDAFPGGHGHRGIRS